MGGVDWYEMFAFCVWDGGRLPTEAEWELAAAGGENSLYPWGNAAPDASVAVFGCSTSCLLPVGSKASGANRRGIMDLGGSLWEYTLDVYSVNWFADPLATCTDCANLTKPTTGGRVVRGGSWKAPGNDLRSGAPRLGYPELA